MDEFLAKTDAIDWGDPAVLARARELAGGSGDPVEITRACFLFVRDGVKHCWDHRLEPVTYRASEALRHRSGWCYAKSHLLAALLRASGVPAGLCYQRLSAGDSGPPHCLHGLNAVRLPGVGWRRLDARGNKEGVEAGFDPRQEQLPFATSPPDERDLPEVWPDPHPAVTRCLTRARTNQEVYENLPDVELW